MADEEGYAAKAPPPSARRVIVTGATGLLGRQVYRVFEEHQWMVRGLGYERAVEPIVKCNLMADDHAQFKAQLDEVKPAMVIHCAAERRPDRLEGKQDYANKINAQLPRELAEVCRERGVWMIYLSTNYVFDGKDAPYAEDAKTNPLSTYGQSKLDGEIAVMGAHPDAAILRVPLLYGPLESLAETSVTALFTSVTADAPKFDNWQERFPTSSDDLAEVLEAFCAAYVERSASAPSDFAGHFHWQANQRHTKYTMAVTIAEIIDAGTDRFVRVDDAPPPNAAPRPQFERMLCTRLEKLLGIEGEPLRFRSDFKESLARYLQPFVHPEAEDVDDEEDQCPELPATPSKKSEEDGSPQAVAKRSDSKISRGSSGSERLRASFSGQDSATCFAGKEFADEKERKKFEDHVLGPTSHDG